MELCKWYESIIKFGYAELTCGITDAETACDGDTGRCQCEVLRQAELRAEADDLQADANRESGKL